MNNENNHEVLDNQDIIVMNSQEAINLVDIYLKRSHLPLLSEIERQLLCDSWKGMTYQGTAYKLSYSPHYTRHLACQMWKRLSSLFEKSVNKRTIHHTLYQCKLASYFPKFYYNQPLALPHYYQPYWYEAYLSKAIIHDYFQVIGIFGMLGTGKSTLAQGIIQQVGRDFDIVVWYSFQAEKLSFNDWFDWVILSITGEAPDSATMTLNQKIAVLMQVLQQKRCLLVLDQVEELFLSQSLAGQYDQEDQGYRKLIQTLATKQHRSYLIFTSRDYPQQYTTELKPKHLFQPLFLSGLSGEQTQKIFQKLGLGQKQNLLPQLQAQYNGNPWSLVQAAFYIQKQYSGNLEYFLQAENFIFDELAEGFAQELQRLSEVEKKVLLSLRKISKPFQKRIFSELPTRLSHSEMEEALSSLEARSLLKIESGFIIVSALVQSYLKTLKENKTGKIKEFAPSL